MAENAPTRTSSRTSATDACRTMQSESGVIDVPKPYSPKYIVFARRKVTSAHSVAPCCFAPIAIGG